MKSHCILILIMALMAIPSMARAQQTNTPPGTIYLVIVDYRGGATNWVVTEFDATTNYLWSFEGLSRSMTARGTAKQRETGTNAAALSSLLAARIDADAASKGPPNNPERLQ